MKKLLLVLCTLGFMLGTNSQTIQLTNGGSTTVSGSTDAAPISAYFEYIRFQVVYTAAEINAAGITGSKTLTNLGWYVSTAPGGGALPNYKIRMANTTATNSAAHDASALTEVYSASYTPVAGGFDMLTLNGSFVWDGTSNLLVDVCFGAAPYVSPYGAVRTYAATTTSGSRRVRCDGCGTQCGNNTNTTNTFKPQVSLTFAPPPSCPAPTVNVVPGSTTAALSWNTVAGATGYEWAVTTSATPPASGTATTGTSANATGLTPLTPYYAHVRSACGAAFSGWSSVPFTTSFDCSTAEVISGCAVPKSVSLSGTGVYNITTCGFNTPGTEKLYSFTPTITGNYTLNITAANAEYIDYFYKAASGGCGATGWTCIDDLNAVSTTVFGPLTAGVTYYILLDPEDATVTSTATFDLICPAGAPPPCTTNLTPTNGATGVSLSPTLTWNAAAGATGYNVFLGTTNPPTTNIGSTATTTANVTGLTANTTYYWYIQPTNTAGGATGCETSTTSFVTTSAPANDTVCGAITLTQGGPQDCKNTANATSVGDPTLPGSCSSPNNTVWYKYVPAANGTVIVRTEIPGATSNALNGWVAWYTATGTCPSPPGLTLTPVAGSACQEFGQTGAGDIDSLTSPNLTAGTTYYIMIDGFGGDNGEFCISLIAPPPPPACVTNVSPANGATGVAIAGPNGAASITWNAAAGASSYDVYFGTVNPPTTLIGNVLAPTVTASITGLQYDTTYYWYIAPRNTGGPATGCAINATSFTVQAAPPNCTPFTTSGCSLSDRIDVFRLKGESSEININTTGTCFSGSYVDSTDYGTVIDLARGKSYWGQIKAGTTSDYVTIWIDFNDNGLFENNERLINNIPVLSTGSGTNINLFIPLSSPTGNHRMRARLVYYSPAPTVPTNPCGSYAYSDTRDYLVNIVAGGSSYTVSTYPSAGVCYDGVGSITIDSASNNNSNYVPLVDSSNNLVAQLYPQNNNLGTVTARYYKHNGPVRQDAFGRYYMDRNLTINVTRQPLTPYNLRFPFLNSELNALIAQPGSGVTSVFDLTCTKNGDNCLNAIGVAAGGAYFPTGFGIIGGTDRFVDITGLVGFSSYYLHGGSTPIPVKVEYFRGTKQGSNHLLDWKVSCTNTQYAKMSIEASRDGRNFSSIYTIRETAVRCQQPFSFNNATPFAGTNYYRLRMEDDHGVVSYSSIVVLINGLKGFELVNIAPNPVTDGQFKLNISSAENKPVDIIITDLSGRIVSKQHINVIAGFNVIDMNVGNLAGGNYQLYGITPDGRTRVLAFVKY